MGIHDTWYTVQNFPMSEKFCLKWNDFHSNVSKSFSKLRNEDDFYDVTLVSDDQKLISAHKVVLSACSEYFKNILKQNKHSNPLLCLEGISYKDINNVLDYIYNGEVNVYQDDVEKFLTIAERFKLEGLIATENDAQNIQNDAEVIINDTKNIVMDYMLDDDDAFYDENIKSEDKKVVVISEDFKNIEELDAKILEYMEKVVGNGWKCKLCEKSFRSKGHLKDHIEIHFEGISFPCKLCDTAVRSRNVLRNHNVKVHKLNKFN